MKTFEVQVQRHVFETVRADGVVFEGGVVMFFDGDKESLVVAHAPGQWLTVHEEEAS